MPAPAPAPAGASAAAAIGAAAGEGAGQGAGEGAEGARPALSLAQRLALLFGALLLLALGCALVIHTLTARQVLREQQDMRNRDAAAALALALSQLKGDAAAMQAVAAAQFDLGHYARLQLVAPDGRSSIALQQPPQPVSAPAWFQRLLPLEVAPGQALVSSGWQELGRLSVAAHTGWAYQALWAATLRTAGLLGSLALLASALTLLLLRAWQRPLAAAVAQAQALEQGRFVEAPLPALPELRQLTRAMNTTVRRMRDLFAAQAQQVAFLQRQAQLDALTGLPSRSQFEHHLRQRLAQEGGGLGLSLVLLRVAGLARLDAQGGRRAADALLQQLGELLADQLAREPDTVGGRIGGADFALSVPLPGLAQDLAQQLWTRLQRLQAQAPQGLRLVLTTLDLLGPPGAAPGGAAAAAPGLPGFAGLPGLAGMPGLPGSAPAQAPSGAAGRPGVTGAAPAAGHAGGAAGTAGQAREARSSAEAAMAAARAALTQAEASGGFLNPPPQPALAAWAGLPAWRAQILAALADGRARLGEFAVLDGQGRLIHLECPLRLQLDPHGEHLPAARWLPLARRAGLLDQVDAMAIHLALQACARDQRPRAVSIDAVSLAAPGFIDEVATRLAAEPAAAARLAVEWVLPPRRHGEADRAPGAACPEAQADQLLHQAQQAVARWRPLGLTLGIEHAGAAPDQLTALRDLGLQYVKVDARHLRGIAADPAVAAYARSLAGLIQLLGLRAYAEGVDQADDLAALWQLGFDGATGPAMRLPASRPLAMTGQAGVPRAGGTLPA